MKAIYDFIVTTDNRYNNKVDVDGKELIVNTEITERDAEFVNRIGKVTAIPTGFETDIQVGDHVILHHNVFRRWYDMKGREMNCRAMIDEKTYRVGAEQIFAYGKPGDWKATLGFCFVKPIKDDSQWREHMYKQLQGELVYTDKYLDSLGMEAGTIVGFTPESEYEFTIDDELYYRIYSTEITINYGFKKETNGET